MTSLSAIPSESDVGEHIQAHPAKRGIQEGTFSDSATFVYVAAWHCVDRSTCPHGQRATPL